MTQKSGFIIFGGTGDLTKRKLAPAIYNLIQKGLLHEKSYIVGIGRSKLTAEDYKQSLEAYLPIGYDEKIWEKLRVYYEKGDVRDDEFFKRIEKILEKIEGGSFNRVYYLAVSYELMPIITNQLNKYCACHNDRYFRRLVFEKPFGNNYKTSLKLNLEIHNGFPEEQVYRIDHYLGKETVENILSLRFANPLFESVWNNKFIEHIRIVVEEDIGVGNRINFYDQTGAIRDMLQSHLLQVASLILMNNPLDDRAESIHNEKIKVLKKLRVKSKDDVVIGQYESYSKEAKASGIAQTKTETYAEVKLTCDNPRWRGTSIILRTGKNLKSKVGYIEIAFKKTPCENYCRRYNIETNKMIINIQPNQNIKFSFNHINPHDKKSFKHVDMNFSREKHFGPNSIEAYEKLLNDCLKGDKTLFTRFDELQESWRVTDELRKISKSKKLYIYKDLSEGPGVLD